jgi:hypothetical protein
MYNPDDWNKDFDLKLKYEPMDSGVITKIVARYKHEEVLDYIKELWSLIDYQKQLINEQNKKIVALKHQQAWQRYNLPEEAYKTSDNKPHKSGNMSC